MIFKYILQLIKLIFKSFIHRIVKCNQCVWYIFFKRILFYKPYSSHNRSYVTVTDKTILRVPEYIIIYIYIYRSYSKTRCELFENLAPNCLWYTRIYRGADRNQLQL